MYLAHFQYHKNNFVFKNVNKLLPNIIETYKNFLQVTDSGISGDMALCFGLLITRGRNQLLLSFE